MEAEFKVRNFRYNLFQRETAIILWSTGRFRPSRFLVDPMLSVLASLINLVDDPCKVCECSPGHKRDCPNRPVVEQVMED